MSLLKLVDRNSYDFDYVSLNPVPAAGMCMDLYIKDAITRVNAGDHLSLRQVIGDKARDTLSPPIFPPPRVAIRV